jgi:putative tryptophan/tyrosine transport system substrate-binding protein
MLSLKRWLGPGDMPSLLKRREFITLISSATAWPIAVRAQQSGLPIVGILSGTSPETAYYVAGVHEGMRGGGYVEGQNFAIETRWAEGNYDRLPALGIELV